jgi:hypothetical protein
MRNDDRTWAGDLVGKKPKKKIALARRSWHNHRSRGQKTTGNARFARAESEALMTVTG